jgi:hypothetical protein
MNKIPLRNSRESLIKLQAHGNMHGQLKTKTKQNKSQQVRPLPICKKKENLYIYN